MCLAPDLERSLRLGLEGASEEGEGEASSSRVAAGQRRTRV